MKFVKQKKKTKTKTKTEKSLKKKTEKNLKKFLSIKIILNSRNINIMLGFVGEGVRRLARTLFSSE